MIMGIHLTPGDVEALADLVRAFGLTPIVFPDISGALDGHVEDSWKPAASGGVTLEDIASMGASQIHAGLRRGDPRGGRRPGEADGRSVSDVSVGVRAEAVRRHRADADERRGRGRCSQPRSSAPAAGWWTLLLTRISIWAG